MTNYYQQSFVCPRMSRSDIECERHEYVRQHDYDCLIPVSKLQEICFACAEKHKQR